MCRTGNPGSSHLLTPALHVSLTLYRRVRICPLRGRNDHGKLQHQCTQDSRNPHCSRSDVVLPQLERGSFCIPRFARYLLSFVVIYIVGIFFHYVSDAQKFFTLRERKGLIEDGLFTSTRNPNYLGEILIYFSYALMSMHWIPFVVLSAWIFGFFVRNMLRKDETLSRHAGFAAYKNRTGLLFPKLIEPAIKAEPLPRS